MVICICQRIIYYFTANDTRISLNKGVAVEGVS